MTHPQLIDLLARHKKILTEAYSQKELSDAPKELVDATLLIEIGDRYVLNQSYVAFVNAILDRVDYGTVFEDYEKEHKNLRRHMRRYRENRSPQLKQWILQAIDDIYLKFYFRDRQMSQVVRRFEQEVSLDIEIIIDEANAILDQITELIDANRAIIETFNELKALDIEFKTKLIPLDESFLRFMQNIDHLTERLGRFITQTKTKRRQNKRFAKVAQDILSENDAYLSEWLTLHSGESAHTLPRTRRHTVIPLVDPDDRRLKRFLKDLKLAKPKPKRAQSKIEEPAPEPLQLIDLEALKRALDRTGCEDLFVCLLKHPEVGGDVQKAFQLYLYLLSEKAVQMSDTFNEHKIRRVRWRG